MADGTYMSVGTPPRKAPQSDINATNLGIDVLSQTPHGRQVLYSNVPLLLAYRAYANPCCVAQSG